MKYKNANGDKTATRDAYNKHMAIEYRYSIIQCSIHVRLNLPFSLALSYTSPPLTSMLIIYTVIQCIRALSFLSLSYNNTCASLSLSLRHLGHRVCYINTLIALSSFFYNSELSFFFHCNGTERKSSDHQYKFTRSLDETRN